MDLNLGFNCNEKACINKEKGSCLSKQALLMLDSNLRFKYPYVQP